MSTEQSESAPAVTAPQVETKAAPAADVEPYTASDDSDCNHAARKKPQACGRRKNGCRKNRLAREEQKKAAEAYKAEKKDKAAAPEAPVPAASTEGESLKSGGLFGLSANQWIAIGGIGVSLLGIYYKRKELKSAFDKFKTPEPAPDPEPVRVTQPKKRLRDML